MDKIKIVKEKGVELPEYKTEGSAGMDLKAFLKNVDFIQIPSLETRLIPTGIKIQLPVGYEAQIRPRSGLSLKQGLVATLGTIDSDYRGEVGVILANLSKETKIVENGDRVAQMVIKKVEHATWDEVEVLDETERGEGGFGHTGIK